MAGDAVQRFETVMFDHELALREEFTGEAFEQICLDPLAREAEAA